VEPIGRDENMMRRASGRDTRTAPSKHVVADDQITARKRLIQIVARASLDKNF